jgi:hypothetical protein
MSSVDRSQLHRFPSADTINREIDRQMLLRLCATDEAMAVCRNMLT